jgi:hypothetical protein
VPTPDTSRYGSMLSVRSGHPRALSLRFARMGLAADFEQILDSLPPDWTDLEVDLRIESESQYVDTAVAVSQVNAQVYQYPLEGWQWRLLVAHSFGHAAAAETVKGVLAKLDGDGVKGELRVAEVREGRSEVVQMWGRPESVREEFRERRSL